MKITSKRHYSRTFKLKCIEEFRVTTLSISEFAASKRIPESTIRTWVKDAGLSTHKAEAVTTANKTEPAVSYR